MAGRQRPAALSGGRYDCHWRRGRRDDSDSVPGVVETERAAQALGAPVEADISKIDPGAMIKVMWRGMAIYIVHRSPEMRAKLDSPELTSRLKIPSRRNPSSRVREEQRARAQSRVAGADRRLHAPRLCADEPLPAADPELGADWPGGFYCPCHGSKFDLSGRVFKDVPAPLNLKVPPYRFMNEGLVQIGVDAEVS
jgi:ubiquinol-cytochrome c reductase iron-sulfur subunit